MNDYNMAYPEVATRLIRSSLEQRWGRLGGMRPISDLFDLNTKVWVVGSTIWKPVTGQTDGINTDLDLLCGSYSAMMDIVGKAKAWAKTMVDDPWVFTPSGSYDVNSYRVTNAAGITILDIWLVPDTLTPEEHILSFTHAYQRCALRPDGTLFRGILRGKAPGTR